MNHIQNRNETIKTICDEYKTIFRIVHHSGKVIKFNAANSQGFYDVVRDEMKSLSQVITDFTKEFIEHEKNNGTALELQEIIREGFSDLSTLFEKTSFLNVGIDIAFSFFIEDDVMGHTEINTIFTKIVETFGNKAESKLMSKIFGGALTLVLLQNSILAAILNLHET